MTCSFACSWIPSHAGGVKLYRIMQLDESDYSHYSTTWNSDCMLHHGVDYKQENLQLWQQLTSASVPLEDIEYVVYKADVGYLQELQENKEVPDQYENAFLRWITAHDRYDIIDLLILAKQNEQIITSMNDPWYYRVEDSYHFKVLAEIVDKCQAYKSGELLDRYALQMVRALCTLREYEKCATYWDCVKRKLSNNAVKKMTELKAASALYKVGRHDEALRIYAKYGDVASIRAINDGTIDNELEFVYNIYPNSPYLAGEIQKWLLYFGDDSTEAGYKNESNDLGSQRIDQLVEVARRAVREKKSKNMAMWYYTLAALYDMQGKPFKAKNYLIQGMAYPKSPFLRDSYRVLNMWIDARTATYDQEYEQRLMDDLKWLIHKIKKEISPDVYNKITPQQEAYWIGNKYNKYYESMGYLDYANSFYWNDAMRRILLREVCPRMHKAGKYVREIQLANLAENLLVQVNDYSNEMFVIMDRLSYKATRNYFSRIYNPQDEFDSFLNSHGKIDKYYWYDILSTKCLRERRYNKAIVYLRQIPEAFHQGMDVYSFMDRDPFSYDIQAFWSDSLPKEKCKLHFAEKMVLYERIMKHKRNPNERAEAKIQYALGLRNSVHRCWYLTRYSSDVANSGLKWSLPDISYPEDESMYQHDMYMKLSDKLINEAIAEFTDKERAAIQLRKLMYYRLIIDNYSETKTANEIIRHCDRWRDYAIYKRNLLRNKKES